MPATVVLPPSTSVLITAITNAADLQRVTLTPPPAMSPPIVWTGTGESNHVIGTSNLSTPAGITNVTVTVDIQHSADGGRTWQASSLIPGSCTVATMNLQVILTEDQVDRDYNDAVVQFLWWEPLQ